MIHGRLVTQFVQFVIRGRFVFPGKAHLYDCWFIADEDSVKRKVLAEQ